MNKMFFDTSDVYGHGHGHRHVVDVRFGVSSEEATNRFQRLFIAEPGAEVLRPALDR